MEFLINNVEDLINFDLERLGKVCDIIIENEGLAARGKIDVIFVDDHFIHDLNLRFRGIDRPTDVLSFELSATPFTGTFEADDIGGEVYVSVDHAIEQAKEQEIPFPEEIARLVFHGLLHLAGYEHQTEQEEQMITDKTEVYLEKFRAM